MPSSRGSVSHDDYVPALCTHRPSLILMAELAKSGDGRVRARPEPAKPVLLEESEVVTRSPLGNQRRDHSEVLATSSGWVCSFFTRLGPTPPPLSLTRVARARGRVRCASTATMDYSARASMKDAAKCDTCCELQDLVSHSFSQRTCARDGSREHVGVRCNPPWAAARGACPRAFVRSTTGCAPDASRLGVYGHSGSRVDPPLGLYAS